MAECELHIACGAHAAASGALVGAGARAGGVPAVCVEARRGVHGNSVPLSGEIEPLAAI
jgi:hypothetical protein